MEIGLVQAYCGEGKGKTTAAIGQGIRAVGRGFKVVMIQFLKGTHTGEIESLLRLEPEFKIFRFEKDRGFYNELTVKDKEEVKMEIDNAFKFAKKILETKECDILILDEILGVLYNDIMSVNELNEFVLAKPKEMELILTGRFLPEEIKHNIDYISFVKQIKHPYQKGICARKGIEF